MERKIRILTSGKYWVDIVMPEVGKGQHWKKYAANWESPQKKRLLLEIT